jgi:hypothetical protein
MSLGESIREVVGMVVGYSEKWTREKIARRYQSEGAEGLGDRQHANSGTKERALLDEEGQAELREALLKGAPPPSGGMWNGPKVARWIEEKTGSEKKVHVQRGWEYLRKVGHTTPQVVPRPSNVRSADASERGAFKKGSPSD